MILDFDLPDNELYRQFQQQKKKLANFARLSLLDSQLEKDNFHAECLSFVLRINLDSIYGGLYQANGDKFQLSTFQNILLSELLLASGLTFFDGDLTYNGSNILARISSLFSGQSNLFRTEVWYKYKELPFLVDGTLLIEKLDTQERQLLKALLDISEINQDKQYEIGYKISLSTASVKSNIHFKNAQVLEQSLRKKLMLLTSDRELNPVVCNEFDISLNAKILSFLVASTLWFKETEYVEITERLNHSLSQWLNQSLELPSSQDLNDKIILVCVALIDYCQIKFDQQVLLLACETMLQFVEKNDLSEEVRISTSQSLLILSKLEIITDRLNESDRNQLYQVINNIQFLEKITIISLQGTNSAQLEQKEQLLSCYDPLLKIYNY